MQKVNFHLQMNACAFHTLCKSHLFESLSFKRISWKASPLPWKIKTRCLYDINIPTGRENKIYESSIEWILQNRLLISVFKIILYHSQFNHVWNIFHYLKKKKIWSNKVYKQQIYLFQIENNLQSIINFFIILYSIYMKTSRYDR